MLERKRWRERKREGGERKDRRDRGERRKRVRVEFKFGASLTESSDRAHMGGGRHGKDEKLSDTINNLLKRCHYTGTKKQGPSKGTKIPWRFWVL